VAGAKLVLDLGIVLRALIGVLDQKRDRRARRHLHATLGMRHDAGENFHSVRLLPLRRETRLSRPAAIQIALDVGLDERDQRRTAVDHAADRDPVAFAKGRDAEQMAEGVVGHDIRKLALSLIINAWSAEQPLLAPFLGGTEHGPEFARVSTVNPGQFRPLGLLYKSGCRPTSPFAIV
jgi:hypothetical protein